MTMAGTTTIDESGGGRPTTNDERDQFMVDEAKKHGLVVITRDKGARKRARLAGVRVFRPDEYAQSVLPFEAARTRFFERLRVGLAEWLKRNGDIPYSRRAVEVLWQLFGAIWAPAGAFSDFKLPVHECTQRPMTILSTQF